MNELDFPSIPIAQEKTGHSLQIRIATPDDLNNIHQVELEAFGVNVLPTVHEQIFAGAGREYVAFKDNKLAGYVALIFQPLDQAKIDAQALDYIFKRKQKYMSDHVAFLGDVDWHLVATKPEYQNQGITKEMLMMVKADLEQRDPSRKIWSALVRFTNPKSIRRIIRTLGMTGLFVQGENIRGDMPYHWNFTDRSNETNIVFTNLVPPTEVSTLKLIKENIWKGKRKPKGNLLLLPVSQGEEKNMTDSEKAKLKYLMAIGMIPSIGKNFGLMNIFSARELEGLGLGLDSIESDKFYLLFFRNPNVFKFVPQERVQKMYKDMASHLPKSPEPTWIR